MFFLCSLGGFSGGGCPRAPPPPPPPPSPQKGLEFPGEWGFSKTKHLKKCIKLNWNFQRGGGSQKKSLQWRRYGYFLELYNGNFNENIYLN